jgi:transcriptional regulator with PAS, ATPase and Fis domain
VLLVAGDREILRSGSRKLERRETFPLVALQGIGELRRYLNAVEADVLRRARDMGASAEDIAEALGITRQGAYYKLRNLDHRPGMGSAGTTRRPRPESAQPT